MDRFAFQYHCAHDYEVWMQMLLAFAMLLALVASCSSALASSVTVPDDFGTIQAAVDSEADTVRIRAGTYPEHPILDLPITLEGIEGEQRPRLSGLTLQQRTHASDTRAWRVRRCEVAGRVLVNPYDHNVLISFSECVLDSGLFANLLGDYHAIELLDIQDCRLGGPVRARASGVHMERDTIDAGVSLEAQDSARILDCWFRGGSGNAIEIFEAGPTAGVIARNRIENYDSGIYFHGEEAHVFESNIIRGMSGAGIYVQGYDATVRNNMITDCGIGIESRVDIPEIHGNTVLRARGAGIMLDASYDPLMLERNVVGDCGGPGLLIRGNQEVTLKNNTVFNNGGSGIAYRRAPGVLHHNISSGNAGWGVSAVEGATLELGCNDWFGNGLGAVEGVAADPTDLNVDPLFCDVEDANVMLMDNSPLLDAAGCGLIGALGLGCGPTPVLVALLRAEASADGVRIEWQWGGRERPADSWIERAPDGSGPWTRIQTERSFDNGITVDRDWRVDAGHRYYYRLAWITEAGERAASEMISITVPSRARFALGPITPNPSTGPIEIAWSLARPGQVDLVVFDIVGRKVAHLASGEFAPGSHRAVWNGRIDGASIAPGLYLVRLRHEDSETTRRILLRR